MHPVEIDIEENGGVLRIRWQDDSVSAIPAAELRLRCDCVECRSTRHGTSTIPLMQSAAKSIREVHLVSSSTLLVVWRDGHDKSYFSFGTLREEFPPAPQNTIA